MCYGVVQSCQIKREGSTNMTKDSLPGHFARADYNEYRSNSIITYESDRTGKRVFVLKRGTNEVFTNMCDAYAAVDRIADKTA